MEMNLSGYQLVFSEDFDGDKLNTDVWKYRCPGNRRCGINDANMVSVSDGFLHIRGAYIDGKWHAGMISLKKHYTRGYFEATVRCAKAVSGGLWSAFWIQSEHPYEAAISKGGIGGAEIDIMECWKDRFSDGYLFMSTIHCAGWQHRYSDNTRNVFSMVSMCLDDLADSFHTFGLAWDKEQYTIYFDNMRLSSCAWADGVSTAPGELILSLELPTEVYIEDPDYTCEYTVDSVRIWQKPEDIAE